MLEIVIPGKAKAVFGISAFAVQADAEAVMFGSKVPMTLTGTFNTEDVSISLTLSNNKLGLNDMFGIPGLSISSISTQVKIIGVAPTCCLFSMTGTLPTFMKELGINLFNGTMTYNTVLNIPNNIIPYISAPLFKNINVNMSYFQTKDFSNYLYNYYQKSKNQESIITANKFNHRYNKNNDIFIHIRLGDVAHLNQGFAYYDEALSRISFENGYIASDDLNHETCKKLIKKYNLKIIDYDEVETIMFGSTCKTIILTGGTFSYIIGLFGFFSNVYYMKGLNNWYPSELFFIDDWIEISI